MKLADRMKEKNTKTTELSIWGPYLREEWEKHFASHLTEEDKERIFLKNKDGYQGYLWHLFSYKLRDCLEREEADEAFQQVAHESYYVFYQLSNEVLILENAARFSVADLEKEYDVYVVDKDFTWTYVKTHETKWCGPYFCKK
ncbi:DUF4275 family protein [Brevibacillus sp. HB2.2]|uniref:DUF4275 family protein n=1 Tax=Brevibacillus sp. HB2.2 TaxID=2738846 RepID=UPI00156AEDDA|nr:DUF4275 family protein [Brevibacillus sp. HB2.2]NRS49525.1 DUF4275 family protein [Brevibacillus sp. HB2.2]